MKEKLEEEANRIYPPNCNFQGEDSEYFERMAYINGGTWIMEKMYSEEEILDLLNKREDYINSEDNIFDYQSTNQWFEQFKKK